MFVRPWHLLGVFLAAACSVPEDDLPLRITDQSGAEFFWACSDAGRCFVHRIAGVSPPLPECNRSAPLFGHAWGRFVAVAAGCGSGDSSGWGFVTDGSRVVVCDADDECPQLDYYDDAFECRHGFCQNVDTAKHPVGRPKRSDLARLCTGGSPRYTNDESYDLASACPDPDYRAPCVSIPPDCPDPG